MNKLKKIISLSNIKKAYLYGKKNGLADMLFAMLERIKQNNKRYEKRKISEEEKECQRMRKWKKDYLFSILVPAYETKENYLLDLIHSCLDQTYTNWELILADASESERVKCVVDTFFDARIRYIRLAQNGGISENTNGALAEAKGDFISLLDHDDWITEDALYQMADRIEQAENMGVDPALLYSDEDKVDAEALQYYEPHIKEDFNLDLLLSNNYICHFLMLRSSLMKKLQLRAEYDGAQDFDLILRAVGELLQRREAIIHVPMVLYHWRCHEASTAQNPQSKMYAYEAGKRAVEDFCKKAGWNVCVEHEKHLGFYRVQYIPNVFMVRKDIGAVCMKLLHGGQVAFGPYRADGLPVCDGLPCRFSGYMHKAVLAQEVFAADIRALQVRPEEKDLYDAFYAEACRTGAFYQAGMDCCEALRRKGYHIVWNPWLEKKI